MNYLKKIWCFNYFNTLAFLQRITSSHRTLNPSHSTIIHPITIRNLKFYMNTIPSGFQPIYKNVTLSGF
jgi:hypothetical protein